MTKLKGWNSSLVDSDILLTMVLIPFFARLLFLWTIFFVTSNWTDPTVNHGFWTDFSTTCSGGRIWQQKWEFLAILGLFNKAMEVVAHLCFMVVLYIYLYLYIYTYVYMCLFSTQAGVFVLIISMIYLWFANVGGSSVEFEVQPNCFCLVNWEDLSHRNWHELTPETVPVFTNYFEAIIIYCRHTVLYMYCNSSHF